MMVFIQPDPHPGKTMTQDFRQQLKHLGQTAKIQRLADEENQRQHRHAQQEHTRFAAAVGEVVPLQNPNQYRHPRDASPIRPRRQEAETRAPEDYVYIGDGGEGEAPPTFSKNGRGEGDIRRLQAKHWPVVARVDLHGYRQEEAQDALNEFVDYVQKRGVCGEIVHGSGLGSAGFLPVLKTRVRRWLMAHPEVLAYAEPHKNNDGAVLILLRRRHQRNPEAE